ncbi:MAG: hypothetical protein QOK15_2970 [Nocardioidaceae bacterium]|jgi:CubicO group peptidase (beta-lactamase class C family)|nr:hypothetical protein [Nocardioidaceae bacterium]
MGSDGSGTATARSATPPTTHGEITDQGVQQALPALPGIIEKYMAATEVPGVAVALIYQGSVLYQQGFGQRQVGREGPNDVSDDTVFQLASVSKSISSTVIASVLSQPDRFPGLSWNDAVHALCPDFTLADPWVGSHVTVADLLAHRSGLPDHAGDLLEDLGYTGAQIIAKLREYPLHRFRDNYDYTNYGFTAGAEAIAAATGRSWQELASELVFQRLGMHESSFTFADLQSRGNRAALHRMVDGRWVPDLGADNDGQAPAGGASASVRDVATWLTMLLDQGLHQGVRIIDVAHLQRIWLPGNVMKGLPSIGGRANFYGLGWNVGYEDTGELRLGHSGAFGRGAATAITMFPSKGLAMVALTNGHPVGLPEAIQVEFLDLVRYGESTQKDWLAFFAPYFIPPPTPDQEKYSEPATGAEPARRLDWYVGTYTNSPYGDLTVSLVDGALSFSLGPDREHFELLHHSGDEFYFTTTGENATGFSGAIFRDASPQGTSLTIGAWDADGLGTFVRR